MEVMVTILQFYLGITDAMHQVHMQVQCNCLGSGHDRVP
jgi:hypothetical protein